MELNQSDKKERILEAAGRLFGKYGPRKTTIDEIAREAGIAKGTVYLYFTSKEDIFLAILRQHIEQLLASLRSAVRSETTAIAKLQKFLTVRFSAPESMREKFSATRESVNESRAFPQILKVRSEYLLGERLIVRDILEAGIERGEFRAMKDLDLVCQSMSSMMQGMIESWLDAEADQMTVQQMVAMYAELVVQGLAKR